MPAKKKPGDVYNDDGELMGEGLDKLTGLFDEDASDEAAATALPSDSAFAQVSDLATKQVRLEDEVTALEIVLKETKKKLRMVSEVEIPEAFADLGLDNISLNTGEKISVTKKIKAGIPTGDKPDSVAKREAAFAWLREHEAEALIKAELKASFGKGAKEKELQEKTVLTLAELGVLVDTKESVPWNTLTSFVKERIANGEPVDWELLGVVELATTKIVRLKQ